MRKLEVGILVGLCVSLSGVARGEVINATTPITITLNTSALVTDTADQTFALEFDLESGSHIAAGGRSAVSFNAPAPPPLGDASNIVTISNFSYGGGSAADPATDPAYFTLGGGTGDIGSSVTLAGTDSENYLSQSFTPGSQLSFTIDFTNNVSDSAITDSFDFGILDGNGTEIPTLGNDIFDSFLIITFDDTVPQVEVFGSDPTAPTSAGVMLDIAAPTASTATPEPGTFWILGLGLVCFALGSKIRKRERRALPAMLAAFVCLVAFGSRGLMAAPQESPEFFTGTYHGKTVTYQVINGYAVTEGDIVIGEATLRTEEGGRRTASMQEYRPDSNTVNLATKLWPKVAGVVTVPYVTTVGSSNMTSAIQAFNTLFAGKFQWVPRTNQRSYVDIDLENQSLNSCFATLGSNGGKAILQGAVGCNVSALLHEMGHNLGLAHEQSRANRSSYIAIDFSNIAPSSQSQYTQDLSSTMDVGLYDYSSIMEYGPRGFTRNGNPEMESIPVGISFGDPPTYSTGDIDALNRIYFAPPSVVTITSNPAGLQIIVDGATLTAPQSFSWALNSTHTLNVPSGPQTVGGTSYIFGRWNSDLAADLNPSRTITVNPGDGSLGSPTTSPAYTAYAVNYIQLAQYNPTPVLDNAFSTTTAAGTVSVNPAPLTFASLTGQYFVNRQVVTLTATPAAGNNFLQFGGPNSGNQTYGRSTNPLTIPSDIIAGTLYVYFASQPEVLITTNVTNNAGGASVTADGTSTKTLAGAWAAATDTGWDAGTTHTLVAATPVSPFFDPNTQYNFTSWSDGTTSATRSITVPATGLLSLGANYTASYKATGNVNSTCAGTVSFSPPLPANNFVVTGTPVTITATPIAPQVFAGWSGTVSGSTNPLTTTVTSELIATANFNLISTPLSVTSISPATLPKGSPAQSITLSGTGFTPANTYAYINLQNRDVTFVDANTITMALTAADLASAKINGIAVQNWNTCGVQVNGPSLVVTP